MLPILALLLAGLQAPSDAVTLKWKFTPGEKFSHEVVSKINQVIKIAEQEYKQDVVHTIVSSFEVLSVEKDGSVVLQETIDSVKATTSQGTPVPSPAINQFTGVVFKLTLSPAGKLLKLEGYEELLRKVAGEDPNSNSVVKTIMSEAQLKQMMEDSFHFLPEKPTAKGAAWQMDATMNFGPLGNLKVNRTLTLAGAEAAPNDKTYRIDIKPTVTYEAPKADAKNTEFTVQSGEMTLENANGTVKFDTATGKLVASELKLKLNGSLNVKLQGKDVVVKMTQEQSVEVRVKK